MGPAEGFSERNQSRIEHVGVGAEDLFGLDFQQLLQLVRQAVTIVVRLALESHPQNRHRLVGEIERPHLGHNEVGKSLVHQHRGMSEEEMIARERGELQSVLEQTRAGRKAGACETSHPGILARDRVVDAVEVETVVFGQHVELVRNREIQIAPAVGEQLGQLSLQVETTQ